MKKYLMMMAASASVLFSACSADSDLLDANNSADNKQEIGFNIVANNSKTGRATSITGTDGLKSTYGNFDVWCLDMGADGSTYTNTYMTQTQIAWQGQSKANAWYYATAGTERYWTNTYLDFYAVSPSSTVTPSISNTGKTFTYTTVDEYNSSNTGADKKENKDILYATAFKQKKGATNTNGKNNYVTMNFKHALSQLVFQVQYNENTIFGKDAKVEIQSITLKNVLSTGTFTFPAAADASASINATGTAYDLTVPFKDGATALNVPKSTETAAVVNDGKTIIVVPQTLTGSTTESGKSYLSIYCKIVSNGSYAKGSSTSYEEVKIPFSQTWAMGKKYTYTLKFDVADDDLIMFDATAEEWSAVDGGTITVK